MQSHCSLYANAAKLATVPDPLIDGNHKLSSSGRLRADEFRTAFGLCVPRLLPVVDRGMV